MTYLLALFLTFFKYLIYFTNFFIYIKIISLRFVLLSVILLLIYLLFKYPKPYGPRFSKLSELRNYRNNFYQIVILSYQIKTIKQFLLTGLAIIFYTLLFVIGFFLLKLLNTNGQIKINEMYDRLLKAYQQLSLLDGIYCLFLSIFSFILLILILVKFKKSFNKSFHRVHLYLFQYDWYSDIAGSIMARYSVNDLVSEIQMVYDNLISYLLLGKIPVWEDGKFVNLTELENNLYLKNKLFRLIYNTGDRLIRFFIEKFHYILIFSAISYDLLLNELILTKVFYVYPFAHLYQLWLNIDKFYTRRSPMFDHSFMQLLYKPETYSLSFINLIPGYILNNFRAPWALEIENSIIRIKRIKNLRRIVKVKRILKKIKCIINK
jgi:hypothetical protein